MGKQVAIYSQYKAPQGFWNVKTSKNSEGEKVETNERVWIKPGKQPLDEDVYEGLLKTSDAFKAEVKAGNIMVHTAKQEKKADDQVAKLVKEKAEMQEKIDKLQGQVNHFTKPKPGPKPGPKPK